MINFLKRRETQRKYYKKHTQKIKLQKKNYREKNKEYYINYRKQHSEKEKIRVKKWSQENSQKIKIYIKRNRLKKYGITVETYNRMLKLQDGICAICLKKESVNINGKIKELSVDHNHTTGIVRQLLCDNCNKAIGFLKEDILSAKNLVNYLIKWKQ